ncbi:MAG: molybdenum cofactor guanylyltransferase [Crocinitomicaceae bacterium]|nr:molybdenum cofactor guanylyltransferase [Crocinitomicaceae bacterium]MBK8925096.1 molybdenum cofactor guanylyltransferase [Crocinitomicaceae bacterium]
MAVFHQVGVILLAGGKSSRMGQDKGLMNLDNKPMISHVLEQAQKISDHILLVANDDAYSQFGYPVFKDDYHELGPMAGIYTGLRNSGYEYNLVLSCDIPFIHQGVLEFLVESCQGNDITVAEFQGKLHPLTAVYRKSCLDVLKKNIEQHKLKLVSVFDELKVRCVDMADFSPENFRNINSLDDLK